MKKILALLSISLLLFACEKNTVEETPGDIPGMGNAAGELQVTPFELPEGIELVGSITGVEDEAIAAMPGNEMLKSTAKNVNNAYCNYGSGGRWIRLKLTMRNTTQYNRTVFFPRGLVLKVEQEGTQNGILLQWTWVCIKPYTTRTFYLDLYCINEGWHGSSISSSYKISGITTSRLFWELMTYVGWKKINYEHYFINSNLKSADELTYDEVADQLQDAVWSLTNGKGLSDEQVEFIESLPELEPGTYPAELNDATVEAPYYFDEYTPVGE